jgi:pyruvate-formate lyase-activating enzyme
VSATVDHRTLYRLPWNLADNAITWLEPTTKCNLYCEGCYRENDPAGHKPLQMVMEELETVKRLRTSDGISIAGGEPLIYPDIVELVSYISSQGWKPILNTNGQALTPELVTKLLDAGLVAFTFHVDSHQDRPGWHDKTEEDLNELRLRLARTVAEFGKGRIACSFNATVYPDTLDQIPMLVDWAQEHVDIVNTMVFILFRSVKPTSSFDGYVRGEKVDVGELVYQLDTQQASKDILAQEAVDRIRRAYPEFDPCGYLNGTEDPAAFKWLVGVRMGNSRRMFGCWDAKMMERVQTLHHRWYGTYLAYSRPGLMRHGRAMLPVALVNKSVARSFWNLIKSPHDWFAPLRIQTLTIIQPCDIMSDGRQSMCDGCPDILPYKGRLVWSCRVDELEKFGAFVTLSPAERAPLEAPLEAPAEVPVDVPVEVGAIALTSEAVSGPNGKRKAGRAPMT